MGHIEPVIRGERWKQLSFTVPMGDKEYFLSNHGRVKSVDINTGKERLLKIYYDRLQYARVNLKIKGKDISFYIHKKMAEYFLNPIEGKENIIHKNLNRKDNRKSNLKLVSDKQRRAYVKERAEKFDFKQKVGGGNYKLTEANVAMIKKYLKTGKTRKKMLAKRFGVTHTQINRIESGENWGHVKPAK